MTSSEPETASSPVKGFKSDKNDGPLLTKRKPELASHDRVSSVDETDESNKKTNLGFSSIPENDASNPIDDERKHVVDKNGDHEDEGQEDDDDDGDDEEDEDEEDDDKEDDDEHVNGARNVDDRKGKGIMEDDKGKGKLIEESEDSSSECASLSNDDDSDLSDDPLAEVDLDNILPTRTRRHIFQPGVNISKARVISKEDQDDASDRKF